MNLNDYVLNRGKRTEKKPVYVGNNMMSMGPPAKPAPRKKNSTPSSDLNWGRSHISVPNSSNQKSTPSKSSSSAELEGKTIVAVTEGRGQARFEVGIAAINLSTPCVILCQISDTQSYVNALTKINILNPQEVLYPTTFDHLTKGNRLLDKLKQQFRDIKYTAVVRRAFNKNNGMERLQRLSIPSADSTLLAVKHRYYALAAASALLTYIQDNLYIFYSSNSIRVEYQASEGYAIIDIDTADRLELVCSAHPAQATKYACLFDVINRCQTRVGSRLLRSIILQPLYSVERIEERLELVSELIKLPSMLCSIQAILQRIPTVEQLLTINTISAPDTTSGSNRQLNYVLLLNSTLDIIEPLKGTLELSDLRFFKNFANLLSSDEFTFIKDYIREMIQDDAYPAKGTNSTSLRAFAIKPGINGLLDLVRKTYNERIGDMQEYVKMLARKHDLPLTLANNNAKGYHMILKLNPQQKKSMKKSDIPDEFIQVFRLAGSFTMKTVEMVNLSTRIDDIMDEILQISNIMIHTMIVKLKDYIGLFYKLCDDIAYLDVLQSLAVTSHANGYVRPKFRNYTEVKSARHPMLDFLCASRPVPNTISSTQDFNMHIITGPNGAGKSIFIRQTLLIQIMAQIGCYVPAETAALRPADRMFARIYMNDDMEWGASTFVLEMKEVQYILETMTGNSLIIIDELCRSTSVEQGTAVAMGICEKLAQSSAFIYVTTHYTLLTKLADICLNVKIWQLETIASGDDPKTFSLDYRYAVVPGIPSVKDYGIYLVRNIWPERVMKHIEEVLEDLRKNVNPQEPKFVPIDEKMRLKYTLESNLRHLKDQKKLTIAELNKYLNEYKRQLETLNFAQQDDLDQDEIGLENLSISSINHGIFDGCFTNNYSNTQRAGDPRFNTTADMFSHPQYYSNQTENINLMSPENNPWIPEVNLSYSSQNTSYLAANQYQLFSVTSNNFCSQDRLNVSQMSDSALSWHMELIRNDQFPQSPINNAQLIPEDVTFLYNTSGSSSKDNFKTLKNCNYSLLQQRNVMSRSSSEISENMNAFSLPLRQGVSRTSTPINKVHSNPQNYSSTSTDKGFTIISGKQPEHDLDIRKELEIFSRSLQEDGHLFDLENIVDSNQGSQQTAIDTSVVEDDTSQCVSQEKEPQNSCPSVKDYSAQQTIKITGQSHNLHRSDCDEISNTRALPNDDENPTNITVSSLNIEEKRMKIHPLSPIVVIKAQADVNYSVDESLSTTCSYSYCKLCKDTTSNTSNDIDQHSKIELDVSVGLKSPLESHESSMAIENKNQSEQIIVDVLTKKNLSCTSMNVSGFQQDPLDDILDASTPSISYSPPNILLLDCSKDPLENYDSFEDVSKDIKALGAGLNLQQAKLGQDIPEIDLDCVKNVLEKRKDAEIELQQKVDKNKEQHNEICIIQNITIVKPQTENYNTEQKYDATVKHHQENLRKQDSVRSSEEFQTCLDTTEKESEAPRKYKLKNRTTGHSQKNKINNAKISSTRKDKQMKEISKLLNSKKKLHTPPALKSFSKPLRSDANQKQNLDNKEEKSPKISTITNSIFDNGLKNDQTDYNQRNGKTSIAEKTTTTSISEASRKRNLDQATSSSIHQRSDSCLDTSIKHKQRDNIIEESTSTTSISEASRKRNLDQAATTTSSTNGSTNSDSNGKGIENHSSVLKTSSAKESDGDEPRPKRGKKSLGARNLCGSSQKAQKKFIPPFRKLTRKEIREEFLAEDRKILEMAGSSSSDQKLQKMYERRLNRPTVKQIQSGTDLVTVMRTNNGVQVIPAPKQVPRMRRRKSVELSRKISHQHSVDISIFSDKNAKVFDEFISSGKKDYTLFNFNFNKDQPLQGSKSGNIFNFQQSKDAARGEFTTNSVSTSFIRSQSYQSQEFLSFLTPTEVGTDSYLFK